MQPENDIVFEQFVKSVSTVTGMGEARSIARIVREDVFANKRFDHLNGEEMAKLKTIENELLTGKPVQYITGYADFYGLRLKVTPDVLIPRQETETLVHEIIRRLRPVAERRRISILDVGTGSGCIALALKKELPNSTVTGIDVSVPALNVAAHNNRMLGLCAGFEKLDFLEERTWSQLAQYDVIVSNPPYIPPSEQSIMPATVKDFEPGLALFVPEDRPLLFYEKLAIFSKTHLKAGGIVAVEINEFRGSEVVQIFEREGFKNVKLIKDLAQADRVVLVET